MASKYWIVSLPVQTSGSALWNQLQGSISKQAFDTPLYRFNTPNLRVGTLDSLLALADDLIKSNAFMEGVTQKIRRQIDELERSSGVNAGALTVDGVPIDSYLTRFVWDEAKYPTMSPLREIVDNIHGFVAKVEDDLKVRVAEYNNVRSQLSAINRKQSGSLAVRDLSNLVKPDDIVASEHLVTLLAVVAKYSQKDWLSSYEALTEYVVPRSSKKLYEDNEYALYTVTLFRRVADNFRTKARERGFQIRDFEYNSETQESQKQELEKLVHDQESLRNSLVQWCFSSYGEVTWSLNFLMIEIFCWRVDRKIRSLVGPYWFILNEGSLLFFPLLREINYWKGKKLSLLCNVQIYLSLAAVSTNVKFEEYSALYKFIELTARITELAVASSGMSTEGQNFESHRTHVVILLSSLLSLSSK